MLKGIFGFSENHEKATFGLGYKLTSIRHEDEAVLDKAVGIADARIKIDHIIGMYPILRLPFNNKVFC